MGQQAALSGILRGQNKPTSRDSYEAMGQQKGQRNESHPAVEPGHVKNSKSRFQTDRKIPSENEGKSSDFTPYGMAVGYLDIPGSLKNLRPARHSVVFHDDEVN